MQIPTNVSAAHLEIKKAAAALQEALCRFTVMQDLNSFGCIEWVDDIDTTLSDLEDAINEEFGD